MTSTKTVKPIHTRAGGQTFRRTDQTTMQNYYRNIHQHVDEVPMAQDRNKTTNNKTDRQFMYNVTLRRLCANIVAVGKQ
jgi:hypothetical protein